MLKVCECGLHEEVAKLAQEDGGETQLLALRALLNLSRAGVGKTHPEPEP